MWDLGQPPLLRCPEMGRALFRVRHRVHGRVRTHSWDWRIPGPAPPTPPGAYLAPDKLSQSDEYAPHPLVQLQGRAAERLPPKLHNHYLEVKGAHRDRERGGETQRVSQGPTQESELAGHSQGAPAAHCPPRLRLGGGLATWMAKVPSTMVQKIGFRKIPSKTFRSPWILRALISLKSCIMTKVLKMMV